MTLLALCRHLGLKLSAQKGRAIWGHICMNLLECLPSGNLVSSSQAVLVSSAALGRTILARYGELRRRARQQLAS